jgi:hypothetical protein
MPESHRQNSRGPQRAHLEFFPVYNDYMQAKMPLEAEEGTRGKNRRRSLKVGNSSYSQQPE